MNYSELIKQALAEDLAGGEDITSVATIAEDATLTAEFVARDSGVIAGIEIAIAVLAEVGAINVETFIEDGSAVSAGDVLIRVTGNARAILLAERTTLNFLGHLSGIASLTNKWVKEIAGTKCQVRDTRKTTPGWRELEKFAVRMGGGTNHRMSLSDAALIKDNHIASAGSVSTAFNRVRSAFPTSPIEIEVDTLAQLIEVLPLKPDLVLLDNMTPDQCRAAVELVAGKTKLEASGGITIELARKYAETGVDYIAIGAITHSAKNFDIGLDIRSNK